jgi:hypothetical protein
MQAAARREQRRTRVSLGARRAAHAIHDRGIGILLDATVVRAILVAAVVSILGRWNWWLPHWPARVLRVKPSLVRPEAAVEEI